MEPKETPMEKPAKDTFDPKDFLAKVGTGKKILQFHKNQHVFEQGVSRTRCFTFKKARSSLQSHPIKVRIPTKSPGYNGMMSPGIPE
jgi:hypothetical protein